jgi:rhodanese-related sulfurtransferase
MQAVVVVAAGAAVAFTYNALSVNGINPFRKIRDVPVVTREEQERRDGILFVDVEEARDIVDACACVMDARTPGEYAAGHIPGAVLFDYYDMGRYVESILPRFSPEDTIMIYCASVTCEDSELLARELYMLGYKELIVFKGGFEAWVGAGLPVDTGPE